MHHLLVSVHIPWLDFPRLACSSIYFQLCFSELTRYLALVGLRGHLPVCRWVSTIGRQWFLRVSRCWSWLQLLTIPAMTTSLALDLDWAPHRFLPSAIADSLHLVWFHSVAHNGLDLHQLTAGNGGVPSHTWLWINFYKSSYWHYPHFLQLPPFARYLLCRHDCYHQCPLSGSCFMVTRFSVQNTYEDSLSSLEAFPVRRKSNSTSQE